MDMLDTIRNDAAATEAAGRLAPSTVAALVEAWAAGSSWDQVRRDTNLDEGDIARVFRRTAELLAQVPRAREIPAETRRAAAKAATLVLRPPITDLT